jgi:membrane protease YdiL (CAAX protease family)
MISVWAGMPAPEINRTAALRKAYHANMRPFSGWVRQNLWALFLLHQLVIFAAAWLFLTAVRGISGRSIHLGQDPIGFIDGTALVLLSAAVIAFTVWLYRWAKGADALPLGIALTPRRVLELLAGLVFGAVFAILPWVLALGNGTARVTDRAGAHFDGFSVIRMVGVGAFLLFVQGVMEEVTNRAFPMRIWEHRSLLFRLLVPAIFFAALHLADEQFAVQRVGILFAFAVILGLAYALTGNIWLASGLHIGGNIATWSISGLWHAGAVVNIAGQPAYPPWVSVLVMLLVMGVAFGVSRRYRNGRTITAAEPHEI